MADFKQSVVFLWERGDKVKKKQKKHSEFYKKSYKKSKKAQKEDLEDLNSLLENESYKIGTFRRNERGFGFVNIGDDENEIFIAPKFTLNAADGDEVLIKILDNIKLANKKQEGKILKIKKHNLDNNKIKFIKESQTILNDFDK